MPEEDLHLSDHMRLQAHERGRPARNHCGQDGRAPGGGRRWISLTGCVTSLAALITLMAHTYADNPHAPWVFLTFCGFSLAELVYPRLRERELRLELEFHPPTSNP